MKGSKEVTWEVRVEDKEDFFFFERREGRGKGT